MSASVPLGETALFMCAGKGNALQWIINGQYVHPSKTHGVNVTYDSWNTGAVWYIPTGVFAYSLKSNLTIRGTRENDNVSIRCDLFIIPKSSHAPVVYLTVLGKLCIDDK